jgi:hypothetical protein
MPTTRPRTRMAGASPIDETSKPHQMLGIETSIYVRRSTDRPITVTVDSDSIPREGLILRFNTAGEGRDVEIWLTEEHAREVVRVLEAAQLSGEGMPECARARLPLSISSFSASG